jgi:hypothetical protein
MKKVVFLFCLALAAIAKPRIQKKNWPTIPRKAVKKLADTTETEGWKSKGNVSLLFNQSSFSNWVAGGENNLSGTAGINYDFNYKKKTLLGTTRFWHRTDSSNPVTRLMKKDRRPF